MTNFINIPALLVMAARLASFRATHIDPMSVLSWIKAIFWTVFWLGPLILVLNTKCTTTQVTAYETGVRKADHSNITFEDFCADGVVYRRFTDTTSGVQNIISREKACTFSRSDLSLFAPKAADKDNK